MSQVHEVMAALPATELDNAEQFSQDEEPVTGLYLPATQCVHGPASGPVDPALQTQAVMPVPSANEVERNGQSAQAEVPGVDLYLPAAHCAHGPPLGPVDSELQIHCVMTVLPAGEVDCNAQAVHPADIPYDPARQLHEIIELIHHLAVQPDSVTVGLEVNCTCIKRCDVVVL